jgi:hypothetical protein
LRLIGAVIQLASLTRSPLLPVGHRPTTLTDHSQTPAGTPNSGFVNFLPVTEMLLTVHPESGERYAAAQRNKELCSAALHFFQTASGAFMGGWTGDLLTPEPSVEDEIPLSSDLDADRITLVEHRAGGVSFAMVHSAAII